jgi:putative ABC transport system permease protein
VQQAEQVYHFQSRAPGYADDAAIWQALRERADVAIVTPALLMQASEQRTAVVVGPADEAASPQRTTDRQPGQTAVVVQGDANEAAQAAEEGLPSFRLQGIPQGATMLPEIWLEVRVAAPASVFGNAGPAPAATTHRVQVIGVLDDDRTLAGTPIQMSLPALQRLTGASITPDNFYVKVVGGADVQSVARALERAFLSSGLDATIMAESFAAGQSVTRGILRLFQGFMALGLLVGIAALGVISSRTVVERRQQVGMLRAIGFQARMVAFSFLLESSFIALTGILIGAMAGLILGENIVATFFTNLTPDSNFVIPWLPIGGILLLAYGFSLLTTILPAYQAARIYPAEALRYE